MSDKREYRFTIVLHPRDGGGYSVMVPALSGCFSHGRSFEQALENAKEAIAAHIEGLLADGEEVPEEGEPTLAVQVKVAA